MLAVDNHRAASYNSSELPVIAGVLFLGICHPYGSSAVLFALSGARVLQCGSAVPPLPSVQIPQSESIY